MNKKIIYELINRDISCSNVKLFIDSILENDFKHLEKVNFYVLAVPFLSNGYTNVFKWKGKYYFSICVNISQYKSDKTMTNKMKWFYIYATIMHEIHHINLLLNDNENWDYATYIAIMEEVEAMRKSIFSRVIRRVMFGNRSKNKIYSVSAAELLCRYKSIRNAYDAFDSILSAEEAKTVQIILESAKYLVEHVEIGYRYDGVPYNRFNKSIICAQKIIKKSSGIFDQYPQLHDLYSVDGKLKSFVAIFQRRNKDNENFIDGVLLRIFMNLEQDYDLIFKDNAPLKKHIEAMADEYCENCISYMEQRDLGLLFLERDILNQNTILLLKNVKYLNKLMENYDMTHTNGSLFYVE